MLRCLVYPSLSAAVVVSFTSHLAPVVKLELFMQIKIVLIIRVAAMQSLSAITGAVQQLCLPGIVPLEAALCLFPLGFYRSMSIFFFSQTLTFSEKQGRGGKN